MKIWKKIKIWFCRQMIELYFEAMRREDQSIDWNKNILDRTTMDVVKITTYRRLEEKHHLWSIRYCNLLFQDEPWYTPAKES